MKSGRDRREAESTATQLLNDGAESEGTQQERIESDLDGYVDAPVR